MYKIFMPNCPPFLPLVTIPSPDITHLSEHCFFAAFLCFPLKSESLHPPLDFATVEGSLCQYLRIPVTSH